MIRHRGLCAISNFLQRQPVVKRPPTHKEIFFYIPPLSPPGELLVKHGDGTHASVRLARCLTGRSAMGLSTRGECYVERAISIV